jgi:hypothetical protein
VKPVIQIGSESGEITEALVSSLKNYNIFPGMLYVNCYQAVIDCEKASIMFPKTRYVLQCQKKIQRWFLATAIPENTLYYFQKFPEVLPPQKPMTLPPLLEANYTFNLLDTKMDSNP